MNFSDFFQQANNGRKPYPYQLQFAEALSLPQLLNVPTGVGKTATAVLGWLYRRRYHPQEDIRHQTPRRLVYCLPMRTLVEQTRDAAKSWLDALHLSPEVGVHVLMGGAELSDWDEYPERDTILIGTQDMLLSRALNRGYGMSRYRWPMHFGLLNNDCLWVMDETQLMGVGLTTTAQLQGLRTKLGTYGVSQSLWMSATLDASPIRTVDHPEPQAGFSRVALSNDDRLHEPVRKRINAKKRLEKAALSLTADTAKRNYPKDLAALIRTHHQPATLTLVVVNNVSRAQEVFRELQNLKGPKTKPTPLTAEVTLIHSRFRPCDRESHEKELFSLDVPSTGRIVVATQAIEAGVDISAATMLTELAPWPSLVQRFGRCNRGGEDKDACVIWLDIESKDDKAKTILPYEADELNNSRSHLAKLNDVGPVALQQITDSRPAPVVHTLRRRDLLDLWDTTPDMAGNDLDVSRFIRDGDDTDVQVFWREFDSGQPADPFPAPQRHELCSVSIGQIHEFLTRLKKNDKRFALIFRPLEKTDQWRPIDPNDVRSGMVLLLKRDMGGYLDGIGWTGNQADKPTPHPPVALAPEEDLSDKENLIAATWVPLQQHLKEVSQAVTRLQGTHSQLPAEIPWAALVRAANWHDIGKAHPAFQNMILRGVADASGRRAELWAKSPGERNGRPQYFADDNATDERIGFRHELASALAWLLHCGDDPDSDLIAFLIAAHHGKVRGSLRSFPNEILPADLGMKQARGIRNGDVIPGCVTGDGQVLPATSLDLSLMELGESESGPSWLARVLKLRDDQSLGPFKLCYLETLLRVADWRGSKTGETFNA
ncbi:CRISPR-associated endonuclease Cas3'' [Schlesneria sp. DSM 10557]|uniref:type I-G CRISPR-associated helicase/endonuclease Cas3g n=1 Tax=Schlesneria sp. DSM 10557 TaxID=3044399 RepID=UPI0035A055D5